MKRLNFVKMSLAVASALAAGVAGNYTYDCLKPIWEAPPSVTDTASKRASTSLPTLVRGWEIELAGTKAILAELDEPNVGRNYAVQEAFNSRGPSLPHWPPKNVVRVIGNIYVRDTSEGRDNCKHAEVHYSIHGPEFVTNGSTAKGMYCKDGGTDEERGLKAIAVAVAALKREVHKATPAELAVQTRKAQLEVWETANATLNSGTRAAWAKCIPCWLYEQGCKVLE